MSRKPRCVILDDYQNVALSFGDWTQLQGKVEVDVVTRHVTDRRELIERLGGAEIIVVNRERTLFDAALIASLPTLKMIITNGRRNAAIDMQVAHERQILVCGAGGRGNPAAEMTWALILAASRHLVEESVALTRRTEWQSTIGIGLAGKTLGLLGLGKVGGRVAQVGLAFEMTVQAFTPSLTDEKASDIGIVRAANLDRLFSDSDIISIHVPLNSSTRGMIGKAQLDIMRTGAILVNTSRYDIVQSQALIEALHGGKLGAAALDVFDQEPLPANHPIRGVPNILLTPHLGYVTDDNYQHYYSGAVDIIRRWLDGDTLADCAL